MKLLLRWADSAKISFKTVYFTVLLEDYEDNFQLKGKLSFFVAYFFNYKPGFGRPKSRGGDADFRHKYQPARLKRG